MILPVTTSLGFVFRRNLRLEDSRTKRKIQHNTTYKCIENNKQISIPPVPVSPRFGCACAKDHRWYRFAQRLQTEKNPSARRRNYSAGRTTPHSEHTTPKIKGILSLIYQTAGAAPGPITEALQAEGFAENPLPTPTHPQRTCQPKVLLERSFVRWVLKPHTEIMMNFKTKQK